MTRASFAARLTTALCGCLFLLSPAFSDPLHKFGKQDAFWHHGSGWIFPRQVAAFELLGTPTQIEGNDDVTADYSMKVNGLSRSATVDIYYPTSAAAGAKLASAKAALQADLGAAECATPQPEGAFTLDGRAEIRGVKVSFAPAGATSCAQSALYFFQTANWVVAVRTWAPATDTDAPAALDAFVRALRWDTLGTDSSRYETMSDPAAW